MRQAARLEFKPQARKETRQGSCIGQSAPVVLLFVAINQKKATKYRRGQCAGQCTVPNKHSSCMIDILAT